MNRTQVLERDGVALVGTHLLDIVLVASLLAVCIAVGLRVLRVARWTTSRPLEEVLYAAGIGMGVLGTALLFLGAAGLYSASGFMILILPVLVVVRREAPGMLEKWWALRTRFVETLRGSCSKMAAVMLFGCTGLVLLVLASPPPIDWDALMYHLEVPRRFLDTGVMHVPEDNLAVAQIGLVQFLYGPLILLGSPAAPALFSATVALLLGVSLYAFCSRFLDGPTAILSAVGIWGTTTVVLTAVTPRIDVTLTFLLFMTQFALFQAVSSRRRGLACLAGLLGGFAFGVKYHAIPYLAALLLVVILLAYRRTGERRFVGNLVLAFVGLASLTTVPWLIKNWILLKAPLYPFFSEALLPPWIADLYGQRHVPDSIPDTLYDLIWSLREPFNLRHAFLSPGRLTIELEGALYFASPILALSPFWFLSGRRSRIAWVILPGFLYLAVLLIVFPETNLRYLIPAVPVLTIAAFDLVVSLGDRFSSRGRGILFAIATVAALLPTILVSGLLVPRAGSVSNLVGELSGREYLRSHPLGAGYFEAVEAVNERLKTGDKAVLIFEGRGFYFNEDVHIDRGARNWVFLNSLLDRRPCLEGSEITHVLVSFGALIYWIETGGLDTDRVDWDRFGDFAKQCLEMTWSNGIFAFYEIKSDPIVTIEGGSSGASFRESWERATSENHPPGRR